MSWWKESQIENFDDRNNANVRVRKLVALSELLKYCAKLIYQTGRGARALAHEVSDNKTLSSFPDVLDILLEADQIAIDSPKKFAFLCHKAAEMLDDKAQRIEQERDFFIQEKNPNRVKGFVDESE